ncbi:MAG: epimerase [Flavobacteriaceae bacterium]|nr:epimerase [Flavobacteriaceae bacterium]|tara:strand:+ start:31717 stop:32688 length:972 start_codon:yes stop_codon:yes gene_type:complete
MKKVLVTGGAGYIGCVMVRQLLNKGYSVRVIDSLKWGGESLFDLITNNDFELQKGDIRNIEDVKKALINVNYVIHLAAIVGDPACSKFSDEAKETNWDGSVNLFQECEKSGVERFVFASTCSNYGKMKDSDSYVKEDSELNPVSLYAELKVKFENYLLNEKNNSNVCSTALRFSTVYGFSPRIRFDLTVNEFTRNMVLENYQEIWGEQFWRPYAHVDDLCRASILVLESKKEKVKSEVFGVGDTNENYQKGMIIREINKLVNGEIKYVAKDEDPRDYRVDFSKIKNKLGFSISKTVPDGISEIKKIVESGIITDCYSSKFKNI